MTTAAFENGTIYYNPSPNSEKEFSGDYLLAEAVYEEVFHILTSNYTLKQSNGKKRRKAGEGTFWDFCAHEIFGGFSRLVDEKWGLERSFKKSKNALIESEDIKPYDIVHKAIYHYIGYKIAVEASENEPVSATRNLSRETNDQLRSRFSSDIEELREYLAQPGEDFGYFIDFNRGHQYANWNGRKGAPVIFFQIEDNIYWGKPDGKEMAGWRKLNRELPDEAKPKAMR